MSYKKASVLYLLIFFCFNCHSNAQKTDELNPLLIGPGTKALGLNETVTAELLGASNLYSNPANLALENHSSFNADYTFWIGNSPHTHAAVNLKKDSRALAFGFISSEAMNIELQNNQSGPTEGNINFLSLSGAYASKFGPLAVGVTAQYLREEFYVYNAHGFAVNFGMGGHLWNKRLRLGTSLLNLGKINEAGNGTKLLPTLFRTGYDAELITFKPPQNDNLPIMVNLKNDWVFPLSNAKSSTLTESVAEPYITIALELDIAGILSFRGGYKTGTVVRHWSSGISIKTGAISAHYAMVPAKAGFQPVHSIGIGYRF